jgi:hypothetical protein
MRSLWKRFVDRGRKEEAEFLADESTMTAGERAIDDEGFEGHQADEFVEEHLGGSDPGRLIEDDRPPPYDGAT